MAPLSFLVLLVLAFSPSAWGNDDSPQGRKRPAECHLPDDGALPRSNTEATATPRAPTHANVVLPLPSSSSTDPAPHEEVITVVDSDEEEDVPPANWHRYVSSPSDRHRLSRLPEFERELELARRWNASILRIQRFEMRMLQEPELTSFDRFVRAERERRRAERSSLPLPSASRTTPHTSRQRRRLLDEGDSEEGCVVKEEKIRVPPLSSRSLGTGHADPIEITDDASDQERDPVPSSSVLIAPTVSPTAPDLASVEEDASLSLSEDAVEDERLLVLATTTTTTTTTTVPPPPVVVTTSTSPVVTTPPRLPTLDRLIGDGIPRHTLSPFSPVSPISPASPAHTPVRTHTPAGSRTPAHTYSAATTSASSPPLDCSAASPACPSVFAALRNVLSPRPLADSRLLSAATSPPPEVDLFSEEASRNHAETVSVSRRDHEGNDVSSSVEGEEEWNLNWSPPVSVASLPVIARQHSSVSGNITPSHIIHDRRRSVPSSLLSDENTLVFGLRRQLSSRVPRRTVSTMPPASSQPVVVAPPPSPTPSVSTGRLLGPLRIPPIVPRAENLQVRSAYRSLFAELLQSPAVPLSGQEGDEEPGSDPDEEDGLFAESVVALENYRARPSSRGGAGRSGSAGNVPQTSQGLGVSDVPTREWEIIPRGAVSEWFPLLPERTSTRDCVACIGHLEMHREQLRMSGEHFARYAARNDRSFTSALGVLPLLDWGENRLRSLYAVTNHSCGCGVPLSLPTVLFTPQSRAMPLGDVAGYGVHLRLFLHLSLPGSPMSWSSSLSFSGVFPLFGALRRYWGRAVWITSDMTLMGFPARSSRQPQITHTTSLHVHPRIPNILRYAPIEVTSTLSYGPRSDIFVYGASLQWAGSVVDGGEDRLLHPATVTRHELIEAHNRPVAPHSFLQEGEGEWTMRFPRRPVGSLPPRSLPVAAEEDRLQLSGRSNACEEESERTDL